MTSHALIAILGAACAYRSRNGMVAATPIDYLRRKRVIQLIDCYHGHIFAIPFARVRYRARRAPGDYIEMKGAAQMLYL